MKLIFSRGSPISPDSTFADQFINHMGNADYLQLVTGYISEDSLLFLMENIKRNKKPHCELLIGMHVYDGFTHSQYNMSKDLGEYLYKNNMGNVVVCCAFPYHGKFYNFFKSKNHFATITGSANITQLIPTRQRNITFNVTDKNALAELSLYFEQLKKSCKSILDYKPNIFKESSFLLKDCIGVAKLNAEELISIFKTKQNNSFHLTLKAEKQSNLNICFGKGRENFNKGIIKPRSWFEFEVIVPKTITSQKGYPRNRRFNVVTDDGWMFECKTQGDYSKNFRSTGGLAVLGMWVKGKLLEAGVVKAGEFITSDMLKKYGSDYLKLTSTTDPNIWMLEYKGN